jgi:hypothetical protein
LEFLSQVILSLLSDLSRPPSECNLIAHRLFLERTEISWKCLEESSPHVGGDKKSRREGQVKGEEGLSGGKQVLEVGSFALPCSSG